MMIFYATTNIQEPVKLDFCHGKKTGLGDLFGALSWNHTFGNSVFCRHRKDCRCHSNRNMKWVALFKIWVPQENVDIHEWVFLAENWECENQFYPEVFFSSGYTKFAYGLKNKTKKYWKTKPTKWKLKKELSVPATLQIL